MSVIRRLAPANPNRLSEHVVSQIADAIVRGELQPGQHLVEAELAASLQVSKSPIREALRELAARGLVTIQPRHGAFVRSLTARDVREIRVLRTALEGLAINLGLERFDAGWVEQLEREISGMRKAQNSGELNAHHLAFHRTLVARCDNTRLLDVLEGMSTQVRSFMAIVERLLPGEAAVAEDHVPLVTAVVSRDPAVVLAVVEAHIGETGRQLEQIWRDAEAAGKLGPIAAGR
jgi:DNA-binding GntR family transcriptional regulator